MAPDIDRVVARTDQGRRDFIKKLIAGAAFAPPLIASFSLDGLTLSAQTVECVGNQNVGPCFDNEDRLDFCGTEYQDNFRGVFRGSDITSGPDLGGTGHCAVNFKGSGGAAGSLWGTVLDTERFNNDSDLTLSADVLIHRFNNNKGAGLLALFNEGPGDKGVALFLMDNGNSDRLQLATVGSDGTVQVLQTAPLGSAIREDQWYRLCFSVGRLFLDVDGTVQLQGSVASHEIPTDPNSPVKSFFGGVCAQISVPEGFFESSSEVGIVARAISAAVDSSVTNFKAEIESTPSPP